MLAAIKCVQVCVCVREEVEGRGTMDKYFNKEFGRTAHWIACFGVVD